MHGRPMICLPPMYGQVGPGTLAASGCSIQRKHSPMKFTIRAYIGSTTGLSWSLHSTAHHSTSLHMGSTTELSLHCASHHVMS